MDELSKKIQLLSVYFSSVWKNKRYIMITMWLFCLIGWSLVALMPNQYKSKATIHADTTSLLKPLLKGLAVQNSVDDQLAIVAQTLLNRKNLEDIARTSDLDIKSDTKEKYEALITKLKKDIHISSGGKRNIYTISYENKNPYLAKKIVGITLQKLVDSQTGNSKKDSIEANQFLNEQIAIYNKKLTQSENALADFKQKNRDSLPNRDSNYYQEINNLKLDITSTSEAISELKTEEQQLKQQLFPTHKENNSEISAVSTPYDARILSLKTTLDQLRVKYTDLHPDVIEVLKLIKALEIKQKETHDAILNQVSQGAITSASYANTDALQEVSLRLSELKSKISVLILRKESATKKLNLLESKIDSIPKIEANLAKLTRTYNSNKQFFERLISRKASAEISRDADENTKDIKFKIIEPPRVPLKPVGPPRILLYILVFILSIILGIFIAFIKDRLNPIIYSKQHLMQYIDESLIAGEIWNDPESEKSYNTNQRIRWIVFTFSTFTLTSILIGLVLCEVTYQQSVIQYLIK